MKQCVICGKEFKVSRNKVCCSTECQCIRTQQTIAEAKKTYRAKPGTREAEARYMREKRANDPYLKARERLFKQSEKYRKQQCVYEKKRRDEGRSWNQLHPELMKDYVRKYQKKNREKMNEKGRKYHKLHPEYQKASKARRRTIESSFGILPKAKDIARRIGLFGGCCYCGEKSVLTLEHLVPLAKGGTNNISNMFGACRGCNCSKQDREWKKWFRKQSFYSIHREYEIGIAACSALF